MSVGTALAQFLYGTLRLAPEYVSVTNLNHDQIAALQATPVALVAAPGANRIVIPTLVMLETKLAVAYAQTTTEIGYSAATTEVVVTDTDAPNLWNNTGSKVEILPLLWLPKLLDRSEANNAPLLLSTSVAPTGGDAANVARVTVLYRVLALDAALA